MLDIKLLIGCYGDQCKKNSVSTHIIVFFCDDLIYQGGELLNKSLSL